MTQSMEAVGHTEGTGPAAEELDRAEGHGTGADVVGDGPDTVARSAKAGTASS